jgi:ATP-binding cassette, subfamily B, bacterial
MSSSSYWKTLRFAASYWALSPRLLAVLISARFVSNIVDVFVPVASGRLADAVTTDERPERVNDLETAGV